MTFTSKEYAKAYRLANVEKYKEYRRKYKESIKTGETPMVRSAVLARQESRKGQVQVRKPRPPKPGHCHRCDILLSYGGGSGTHCEECLNEMGVL